MEYNWGVNGRFLCHLGYSGQNSNNVPIYRFAKAPGEEIWE